MSLLVEIELCRNCHLHSWCSRHDEVKYIDYYEQLAQRIITAIPEAKVTQRKPADDIAVRKTPANDGALYFNISTGQAVHFPRLGSFEVYIDGVRIFSKLRSKIWPKFEKVIEKIKQLQIAKQNGEDLKVFDVDYVDPSIKPKVNADLYNIQTIFRVRKSSVKNQTNQMSSTAREGSRQRQLNKSVQLDKRFNQFNPEFDAMFQQISPKPDKQTNKWLQKWNLQDGPNNQKLSPYLGQIIPKQKRRKLLMSKLDSKHILLQNEEGQKTVYKKQQKIDYQTQRLNIDSGTSGGNTIRGTSRHNRRKLAPLPNTKTNAKINQNNLEDNKIQQNQKQEVNLYDELDLSQQEKQDLIQKQTKTINEGKQTNNSHVRSSKKIESHEIKEQQSQEQYQFEQIEQSDRKQEKQMAKIDKNVYPVKQQKKEQKQKLKTKSDRVESEIQSQKYQQQIQQVEQEEQNKFDRLQMQMDDKSEQEQQEQQVKHEPKQEGQEGQQINQQQQVQQAQQVQQVQQQNDQKQELAEELIEDEERKVDEKIGKEEIKQEQKQKPTQIVAHKQIKQTNKEPTNDTKNVEQNKKQQIQNQKRQQQIKMVQTKVIEEKEPEEIKQQNQDSKPAEKQNIISNQPKQNKQNEQKDENKKQYPQLKWKCKYIQSQFHLIQDIPRQTMQKQKIDTNDVNEKKNQETISNINEISSVVVPLPIIEQKNQQYQQSQINEQTKQETKPTPQIQDTNNRKKQQKQETTQPAVSPFRKQTKPIVVQQIKHQEYACVFQKYGILNWDTKVKYQTEEYFLITQQNIVFENSELKQPSKVENADKPLQNPQKQDQNIKSNQSPTQLKINGNSIQWTAHFEQGKYRLNKTPKNLQIKEIQASNSEKNVHKVVI